MVAALPTEDGIIAHLRILPGAETVPVSAVEELQRFVQDFHQVHLNERDMQRAFAHVYYAADALREWIVQEMTATPDIYILRPGDERPGGWRDFTEQKAQGERYGDALLKARGDFTRIALEHKFLEA